MEVYLKLRNGAWMLINKKIEQTTVSSKRRVTRFILAGTTVKGPPSGFENEVVKVPATVVNRVISRLLDVKEKDIVVVEPVDPEHYAIRVPRGKRDVVESILREIAARKRAKGRETS